QAEDGIRDRNVTGVQTCALPILYSIATLVLARNEEQVQKLTADFIGTYLPQEWEDAAQRVVDAVVGSTQQSTLMLVLSVVLALRSEERRVGEGGRCRWA